MMPGTYPPDAECCIEDHDGECRRAVAHSVAITVPRGVRRFYVCDHHWLAGAREVFAKVAAAARPTEDDAP